ncbi:hypothetical protein PF005_g15436 [Phytophthora fragariae]|uniref:Uncharacterized protein n=1 Tax=Phytophthora fragariae TaxID=53985 RepID=A0A6A3XL31_9STRA|nr:hypothetical protein PF003_g36050 [Phytophthora fragariae]KAE8996068.1 hypothetical protein PF011_g16059 [Phytophthora fragariae]KAE9200225.1 hypothetical protein PF005_g15436 [Phytophthora fragariae]
MAAWRLLWLPDVVEVLISRVAMYVVPLLLKDPGCVPVLIKRLQEEATKEQIDGEAADVALWAELKVLKFALKKMAPEKLVVDQHAHRRLVKYYLVVNGKEIGPAGRMNSLIGLKTVLIRIKETMRLASKNQTKPNPTASARDDYAAAAAFKQWVELFVVTSVYPGALPQRLTLGLEVLLLYVQLFGFGNDEAHAKKEAFTKPFAHRPNGDDPSEHAHQRMGLDSLKQRLGQENQSFRRHLEDLVSQQMAQIREVQDNETERIHEEMDEIRSGM